MPSELSESLGVARQAAAAAAAIIRNRAPEGLRNKGAIDLVTAVDLAAEDAIRVELQRHTPDIPILAEESGGAWKETTRWIVDPLDGTTNFVHGFPSYGVSIALEVAGVLTVGTVVDPLRDHRYEAARGHGAHCNDQPIHVSDAPTLEQALLLTGFAYDRRERVDFYLEYFKRFLLSARGIRRAGAAALDFAHVAAGHADGFWEFGLNAWDVAAGALLVEEAGGRVSDVHLGPLDLARPRVLATNGWVHEAMAEILSDVEAS